MGFVSSKTFSSASSLIRLSTANVTISSSALRNSSAVGSGMVCSFHVCYHFGSVSKLLLMREPSPDNSDSGSDGQRKICTGQSTNGASHHEGEDREKWVQLEFMSKNPRGDPIVDQQSPDTQ